MEKTFNELAKIFDVSPNAPFQLTPEEQSKCLELLQSVTKWNDDSKESEVHKILDSGPLDSIRQAKELLAQSRMPKKSSSSPMKIELPQPQLQHPIAISMSSMEESPKKIYITREAKRILETINNESVMENAESLIIKPKDIIKSLPIYHFNLPEGIQQKVFPHIESSTLPIYTFSDQ